MLLTKALLHFIYPSHCLHCKITLLDEKPLCQDCLKLMELATLDERCPLCFSLDYNVENQICYSCFINKPLLDGYGTVFDYEGPAKSLISHLKYLNKPYLAKGMGSYMAMQFLQLKFPTPDIIIPVPLSFLRKITRGYNQSLLLAEEIGVLLNVPVKEVVGRRLLDYSQAKLSRTQRLQLNSSSFYIKTKTDLQDKVVLIVDDVLTTGTTLNSMAEILLSMHPKAVYGLSFCKAF